MNLKQGYTDAPNVVIPGVSLEMRMALGPKGFWSIHARFIIKPLKFFRNFDLILNSWAGEGENGWWEENHTPTPINKNSTYTINRYVYIP